MNKQIWKNTVLAAALAAFVAPAFAQDSGDADGALAIEVITVTARKRSQSIQDTPLAISAFSSQELKAAAFDGIVEVSRAAPGVFIETVNSIPARVDIAPRFRGVTFESTSPLGRTASIFVDGILVSGGISSISVQELERLEIIKGPQSATFGRNTFSGAINYITRDPGDEFGGSASLSIGSEGEYRFDGGIEGSLIDNVLGARLSVSYSDKEGHFANAAVPGQTLGDEESFSVGGALVYEPSDRVRFKLRSSFYRDEDGPAAVVLTSGFAQHNFGGFAIPGGGTTETAYRGIVQVPTGADIGLNTDQATYDNVIGAAQADSRPIMSTGLTFADLGGPGLIREGYRVALTGNFELSDTVNLDVLAGYNEDEFLTFNDFDGTASAAGFITVGGRQVRDTSIEARLSGVAMDDRLNWSFGANYVDIYVEGVGGFWDTFGFWFGGLFNDRPITGAKTKGIFGSLEYAFSDSFTAIVELRSQEDEISNAALPLVSPGTFDSVLPRVLLQFKPTDDSMVYFNYSVGNLPGGFNPEIGELDAVQLAEFAGLAPGIGTTYDEESLDNFELGWKQTALDGRLAFNLAGYYMERTDQIFSGFELVTDTNPDPGSTNAFRTVAFTANGASSDIFGLEADATWNVTEALSLQATLGVINAKIKSFPEGSNSGDFTAVFGPNASVEGQRSPRFPEKSASLSATYEVPVSIGGGSDWFTRADVYYTGEFFDENTNLAVLPEATEVNLRSGLRFERYSAELFVTNVFDEDAPIAGNNIADTSAAVRFGSAPYDFSQESVHVQLRDERQFGVRFTVEF